MYVPRTYSQEFFSRVNYFLNFTRQEWPRYPVIVPVIDLSSSILCHWFLLLRCDSPFIRLRSAWHEYDDIALLASFLGKKTKLSRPNNSSSNLTHYYFQLCIDEWEVKVLRSIYVCIRFDILYHFLSTPPLISFIFSPLPIIGKKHRNLICTLWEENDIIMQLYEKKLLHLKNAVSLFLEKFKN